jgi:hypothetical protein
MNTTYYALLIGASHAQIYFILELLNTNWEKNLIHH